MSKPMIDTKRSAGYRDKNESGNAALLNIGKIQGVVFTEPDQLGSTPGEYNGGSVALPSTPSIPSEVATGLISKSTDRFVSVVPLLSRFTHSRNLSLMKRSLSYVQITAAYPLLHFIDDSHADMTKLTFDYATYGSVASYSKLAAIASNTGDIYHPLFIRVAKLALATKEAVVAASNDKSIFFLMEAPEIYDRILKHFFLVSFAAADAIKLMKFRAILPKIETGWSTLYHESAGVRDALRGENLYNALDSVIFTLNTSVSGSKFDQELLEEVLSVDDYSLMPNQEGSLRILHSLGLVSKVDSFITPSTATTNFLNHSLLRTNIADWVAYFGASDIRDLEANLTAIGVIPNLKMPSAVEPFVNATLIKRIGGSAVYGRGFLVPHDCGVSPFSGSFTQNYLLRPTLLEGAYVGRAPIANMFRNISVLVGKGSQPVLAYPEIKTGGVVNVKYEALDSIPNNKAKAAVTLAGFSDDFVWPRMRSTATITPTLRKVNNVRSLVLVGCNYASLASYDDTQAPGGASFIDFTAASVDDAVFDTLNGAFMLPSAVARHIMWFPQTESQTLSGYTFKFFGPTLKQLGATSTITIPAVFAAPLNGANTVAEINVTTGPERTWLRTASLMQFFIDMINVSYGLGLPFSAYLKTKDSVTGDYVSGPQTLYVASHLPEKDAGAQADEPFMHAVNPVAPYLFSYRDAITTESRVSFDLVSARYRVGVKYRQGLYAKIGI